MSVAVKKDRKVYSITDAGQGVLSSTPVPEEKIDESQDTTWAPKWVDVRGVLSFASTVAGLPARMDSVLTRIDQGLVSVRLPEVEKGVRRLNRSTHRLSVGVLTAAIFVGGIALRINGDELGNYLLLGSIPLAIYAIGLFRLP